MNKFIMNNQEFTIKEVTQKEMFDYYNEENIGYYYGQSHFKTNEVWLSKEQPLSRKRETLYHELMHCYINCFFTTQDMTFTEEQLCDISSKAHNIIEKICNTYFKSKLKENK